MRSVDAIPSLIDDADFLAAIDKLETDPAPHEADAVSDYWEQASRVDEGEDRSDARMQQAPGLAPRVQRTRSAEPVPPVRIEKRVRTETPSSPRVGRVGDPGPDRIDTPVRPDGPARHDRPVHRERPVPPAHVDEIGQSARTRANELAAGSASLQRLVPASLVVLTVVLCYGAGAGSAALVFRDRVEQVVATWQK
jgi:hypothetical protein